MKEKAVLSSREPPKTKPRLSEAQLLWRDTEPHGRRQQASGLSVTGVTFLSILSAEVMVFLPTGVLANQS